MSLICFKNRQKLKKGYNSFRYFHFISKIFQITSMQINILTILQFTEVDTSRFVRFFAIRADPNSPWAEPSRAGSLPARAESELSRAELSSDATLVATIQGRRLMTRVQYLIMFVQSTRIKRLLTKKYLETAKAIDWNKSDGNQHQWVSWYEINHAK